MKNILFVLTLLFITIIGNAQVPPARSYYDSTAKKIIKERYETNSQGERHGLYILFSKEGKILEQGKYINGIKNGRWKENFQEGYYSEGLYVNGKRDGIWKNSAIDLSQMRWEMDSATEFEVVLKMEKDKSVTFKNGKVIQ